MVNGPMDFLATKDIWTGKVIMGMFIAEIVI